MQRRPGGTGPGWRALPVGPGGVPPDQVRPVGPDGATVPDRPPEQSPIRPPAPELARPAPWPPFPPAPIDPGRSTTEPRAVVGWFGTADPFARPDADRPLAGDAGPDPADPVRRRRRAVLAVACLGLVALAVVLAGLLSTGPGAGGFRIGRRSEPGDCLASAGGTTVIALDCDAPEAEFVIAARFDRTTDDGRCVATAADVVLVTRDDAVMCLNYVARSASASTPATPTTSARPPAGRRAPPPAACSGCSRCWPAPSAPPTAGRHPAHPGAPGRS